MARHPARCGSADSGGENYRADLPNGCGKSTLLRALGRQQPLSAGCVRLGEASIRDLSARQFARHVAFLPQQPVTPEGVTVREVIAYGRYPYTGAFASLSTRDHEAIEKAAVKAGWSSCWMCLPRNYQAVSANGFGWR